MVLELVESIFAFHLLYEEQHQVQPLVWGSSLELIINISTRELPHRHCTTSTTPSWQEQGKLKWPSCLLVNRITTGLPWSLILQKRWYVHHLPHSPLSMSLIEFQFISSISNSTIRAMLALHDPCGWLAYVLFLTHCLDACEQISLGISCWSK
jgi:hypothetical protein